MINNKMIATLACVSLALASCTKLEEKFNGQLTASQIGSGSGSGNVTALLNGVYTSMRSTYEDQGNVYALWEMTTDEWIGPTRGGDWDDNGAWRVLHTHRFDGDNAHVIDTWNGLNGTVYAATDLLRFNPSPQQAAEAKFLRAFSQFLILDGYDQVPYRSPGESPIIAPRVVKGAEALKWIMDTINAILPNLPDGPVGKANKDAAKVLLMKCYLNKGVFANRQTPTFDAADMQQVVTLADGIINSGKYSFATNYFDNFAPNNDVVGKEDIWTLPNDGGVSSGGLRSRWHCTMHYNQKPSGWNGFTTLSDFYNKFEPADKRRGVAYPTNSATYSNPGKRVNVGFLVGQQYDMRDDAPLKDRTGAPLIFTPEVKIIEKGTNLEVTGIRAYKFPIDFQFDDNGNVDNDYVFFRYADVLLMKAEALLRSNQAAAALVIVNQIRADRGASALTSLSLDNMLDERGREMYLECWRRQDLIRFGKFLQPFQEKPDVSDAKYLLFPIPNGQLAANPNLTKNPGY